MKDSEHLQLEEKFNSFISECCEWHEDIDNELQELVTLLTHDAFIDAVIRFGIIIERNKQRHKELITLNVDEELNDN